MALNLELDFQPWMTDAVCASVDPECFFPRKGGSTRPAKTVCRGCDVKSDCLQYAIENEINWGVWGGLSERERRPLKHEAAT